jgi:hypothetical protein
MSPTFIADTLLRAGLIPASQHAKIGQREQHRLFSLNWELRAVLYFGLLLLASGLGLLVYENYAQIGRLAILGGIGGLCAASFGFAIWHRPPWTTDMARSRSALGDYALLLGCLLFLVLEGYAQYEYQIFGTRYGLVTLSPALLFLAVAYRFDHRGVLGMGLTALISWVGVTVRPLELYVRTNFFSGRVIVSALLLAALLIGAGLWLERQRIKAHFTDVWLTVAENLLFVALLGALFNFTDWHGLAVPGLIVACIGFDWLARRRRQLWLLVLASVYGYIGLTYLFFHYLAGDASPMTGSLYFLMSSVGLIIFLLRRRRQTDTNETV